MATPSIGPASKPLTYMECFWGDCIWGAKPQLQSLGLGAGLAFPGESGGPKRVLRVIDPRGFPTRINADYEPGRYCAHIDFPGRDRPKRDWEPFAPGVRRQCFGYFDYFVGTGTDLVAADLVRADQFPGMPGMRKVRVTILADGTIPTGAPTANLPASLKNGSGARTVERAGVNTYRVAVKVDDAVGQRRWEAERAQEDQWVRQMWALPRPPRLQPIGSVPALACNARPSPAPAARSTSLFDLNPAEVRAKEAFAHQAMKTLRELVDFSQESVYEID